MSLAMAAEPVARRWVCGAVLAAVAAAAAYAAIDRGGVARGVVSNAASVTIGGVSYDVSQALITIDGTIGTRDDLRTGQLLEVLDIVYPEKDGHPVAGQIVFRDAVQGAVLQVSGDLAAGVSELLVLGQRVTVDASTQIEASLGPVEALPVGTRIEVSGFAGLTGEIRATRLDPAPAGADELTGEVRELAQTRLRIGGQLVDVSRAQLIGFDAPVSNGDWVEVRGKLSGRLLVAMELERRVRGLTGEALQEAQLEGVVTRVSSASDFDVDGTPIMFNAHTRWTGVGPKDLAAGMLVSVQGELDEAGTTITARAVELLVPQAEQAGQ